jgi:hypothetical protein
MEHSQKVTLTPFENESPPQLIPSTETNIKYLSNIPSETSTIGTQTTKKIKSHPYLEKYVNQIKIILKLAKIDGYDNNLRIKNENGNFIENSNIINLLQNATIAAKVLIGQDAFINLLFNAGVEPDLIVNENVKSKLIRLYETKSKSTQTFKELEPRIYTSNATKNDLIVEPTVKFNKRQREKTDDIEETEEINPKRTKWILPNYEENE